MNAKTLVWGVAVLGSLCCSSGGEAQSVTPVKPDVILQAEQGSTVLSPSRVPVTQVKKEEAPPGTKVSLYSSSAVSNADARAITVKPNDTDTVDFALNNAMNWPAGSYVGQLNGFGGVQINVRHAYWKAVLAILSALVLGYLAAWLRRVPETTALRQRVLLARQKADAALIESAAFRYTYKPALLAEYDKLDLSLIHI